jgi:regulator of protease activity HflC (stomatin/prohibitin superfamily)
LYIALGCIGALAICTFFFAFIVSRSALVSIEPDQRGVVISAIEPTGYRPNPMGPGLHLIIPMLENVKVYSIAPQTYVMSPQSSSGDDSIKAVTRDGQTVKIGVSVVYALDPEKIFDLYMTWQDRYEDGFIRPVTRSTTRDIVLRYDATDLNSKKVEIVQTISDQLNQKFAENDFILKGYSIGDVLIP